MRFPIVRILMRTQSERKLRIEERMIPANKDLQEFG